MEPRLTLSDAPQPRLRQAVEAALLASAEAAGVVTDYRPLEIAVHREGAMVGGLVGRTGRGWLNIEYLALPASEQGTGLGARLMAMAEAEAVARGCTAATLSTMQFQAPGFYESLGYAEFGRTTGAPDAFTRIHFIKRFQAAPVRGGWTVALDPDPGPATYRAIMGPLRDFNQSQVGTGGFRPLAVALRDPAGLIVGGLWGYTWQNWLFVELLTAGPARGQGLGTEIMRLAEAEALVRGCTGIWLDTFTFQAPAFYQGLGFTEFGRLDEYPLGHARIFYAKRIG